MKFQTSITEIKNEKEYIHGEPLEQLIADRSFGESIYFLLRGEFPSETHNRMFNALLVAAIDHGPGTASGQVSRIVASAKNSLHVAVAAGLLAMGGRHGSAIEGAAVFFQTHFSTPNIAALAQDCKDKKMRVPGFGHAVLSEDHRSNALFSVAKEQQVFGKYCEFALNFHQALNAVSSKQLPINVDGAMAAILLDMGFDPSMMKGIFMISRLPGLVAQAHEEMINDVGIRRLEESDIEYIHP